MIQSDNDKEFDNAGNKVGQVLIKGFLVVFFAVATVTIITQIIISNQ